jgi:hypothetical protein
LVEPTRSEKTTVTVLRVSAAGAVDSTAEQAMQNRALAGFSSPQFEQTGTPAV